MKTSVVRKLGARQDILMNVLITEDAVSWFNLSEDSEDGKIRVQAFILSAEIFETSQSSDLT